MFAGINHTRHFLMEGSVCYVMLFRMNITLFVFVNYCKQLRRRYIPEYYFKRPNKHKFIKLMSNDDTNTVCNLANFVFKAFLIWKSHAAIST